MLVAYFSLEFGLDAGIPLYSGGLGILAGDHLKSASDLGVPLVGVGLLYRSGYFRQSLGPDGGQRERYPATDWSDLPLSDRPAPTASRSWSRCEIGDETVRAAVRRIQVGRVPLLLLDADIEGNSPRARDDHRARSTAATASSASARRSCSASAASARWPRPGMAPTVFHMNEGHSALLALERMRALIGRLRPDLAEAREQVRRLDGLHHPHAGAGRQRDLRPRARAQLPRAARRRGRA